MAVTVRFVGAGNVIANTLTDVAHKKIRDRKYRILLLLMIMLDKK